MRRSIAAIPCLAGAFVLCFATSLQAQALNQIWDVDGPDNGERMGWSAAAAGLVDGDAVPDAIVGSPRADINGTSSGTATVLSGATGAVIHEVHGDLTSDQLGYAVGSIGDVGVDGRAEFIVGAPFDDTTATNAGMARVYDGATGGTLYTYYGDATTDEFGRAVGGGADVDGDGTPDILIGAPQLSGGDGYVRIFSGDDGLLIRTLTSPVPGAGFGASVAGLGDLDGDGFDEIVVGAFTDAGGGVSRGRAYVYAGIDGTVMHAFDGEADFDWLGWSVAAAGDANHDGVMDIAVGAYGHDGGADAGGRAYVFSGADWSQLAVVTGATDNEQLGWVVAGAGDVDGNGDDDLIVGAPFGDQGRALVVSGTDSAVLHELTGNDTGDTFGRAVLGFGGDLDGDGHDDVAVGAPLDDDNGTSAGALTTFSGHETWRDLGGGTLGIAGQPTLMGAGTLVGGSSASVALSNAPPSATMLAWISFAPTPFAALGGTVHAFPHASQLTFFASGTGTFAGATTWPVGIPPGTQVWFQFIVQDLSTLHGITLSNGLRATTP